MRLTLTIIAVAAFTAQPLIAYAQDAESADEGPTPQPSQGAPNQAPPPPSAKTPPPPSGDDQQVTEQAPQDQGGALPQGQWTYTSQYGWVYLPYSQDYTYVGDNGDVAFTYGYYPQYGWSWLPSPWVLGWGPRPYWGHYGYGHFAWYSHPWFHVGIYHPGVWARWGHPWAARHSYAWGRGVYAHPYAGYHGGYERAGHPVGHAAVGHPMGHAMGHPAMHGGGGHRR